VDAIVEAAARVIECDGIDACNTNRVADRAGVSIGTLYQYFPDRESLFVALTRRERNALVVEIETILATPRSSLSEVLQMLVSAGVKHQLSRPALAARLDVLEPALNLDQETLALGRVVGDHLTALLIHHGVGGPAHVAQDIAALTKGLIDAAGYAGETDVLCLEARVWRAVTGYLQDQTGGRLGRAHIQA
jgi:AcrR family transcriptional regulator